jgi:uncharacterized protein DUF6404
MRAGHVGCQFGRAGPPASLSFHVSQKMTHEEKVALAISDLTTRGVSKGTVAPPLFKLAWKLGIAIPPPHFLSFFGLALLMGSFFGVLWGLLMCFAFWSRTGLSTRGALIASLAAGVLFGLAMAFYYRRKARKLNLPLWCEYGTNG